MLTLDQASLVLQLAAWGVKNPGALSWLDPPPVTGWEEAGHLLADLGALDSQGAITRIGREMVLLPLHPRLSHLLIKSFELGCPRLGVDLAALLSERDILRPQDPRAGRQKGKGSGLSERLDLLRDWRKGKPVTPAADPFALQAVDRVARELLKTGKQGNPLAGPIKSPTAKRWNRESRTGSDHMNQMI